VNRQTTSDSSNPSLRSFHFSAILASDTQILSRARV